jgi:hypothetical protein
MDAIAARWRDLAALLKQQSPMRGLIPPTDG